jgi:hypothetical protein
MTTLTIWIIILIITIIIVMIFWYIFSYSYNDLLKNNFYLKDSDYMNIGYDKYGNVYTNDIYHIRQIPTKIFYTEKEMINISLLNEKDSKIKYQFTIIFTDKNGLFINDQNTLDDQTNINKFNVEPYKYFFLVFNIITTIDGEDKSVIINPKTFNKIKNILKFKVLKN